MGFCERLAIPNDESGTFIKEEMVRLWNADMANISEKVKVKNFVELKAKGYLDQALFRMAYRSKRLEAFKEE